MGMNVSNGEKVRGEINITPLVDVVLVLLIIFMVVTPLLQMGYDVQVPPAVKTPIPSPAEDQLMVRMDAQGSTFINRQPVPLAHFGAKLAEALAGRQSRVVFFAAEGDLEYGKVASFMDLCRDHGALTLGIVFDDMK